MTIAALRTLCSQIPWCEPTVLESALELALEIAREGREGRRIGTLFTVGKADDVLAASRALILDPLTGHVPARTHISDPNLRGTIKELAQLDGAFVISESGVVRVFHAGQVEATLIPELWLLDRHHTQLSVAAAGVIETQRLGTAMRSLGGVGEES